MAGEPARKRRRASAASAGSATAAARAAMETDQDAAEPGHKTQASAEEASEKNGKTMEVAEGEEEEEEDVPIVDMWLRIDLGNAKNCKVLAKLDREEALLMQLWPIISKDVDGCHADIIHVSVALLWYATSGKRALLVQGMSQHAVFPDYVQRVVRQFTQLDPRASETRNVSTSYLGMFSLFFGRMDLQSVRSSLLRLSSHELWNLVDEERLARHLSEQGSALRQQWKTLNSKSIDDSEKEYIHGFWRSVFAHALIGVSLRARKEALKFITNCLMSPMLRRFLALLVEDASLVARLELQVSADDHSTHVLLEKLDQALVCATKRSEEVRRFRTARVRLLQRVLDRHFSESHANLAFLPVSKAQVAINEEGTLAKTLNANQLAALCDYLGLSTRRVPSLHGCKPEELTSPQSKAFLAKVLQVAHRPVKPFGKCTKDKGDAKAWFLLPGGSNVAFEDDLLKLENEGRARATLVREALACRLQHISEEAMIEENLVHMMEEARFALAYDLRRALELLAVRGDASSPTKISFGGWARMAMPCSLLTRSSVKCSFVDTPRPIVAEWASLPVSQLSVVLCAVELDPKTKNRCRVTAIYPAQVRSVDLAGGVVSLHWICNDKQPIHNENAPQQQQYVLVRRKWANDVPRRVGLALIKQLMDSSEQKLLPDAFAHFLLGHGKALQRATDDRLRLMHYSGDAFVGDIVEELVGPNPDKTLIVVPDEVHAVVLVQYLAKETAHPFTRLRRPDISGRIAACLQRRLELLAEVEEIATGLGVAGASHFSCETALHFYRLYVQPELKAYEASEEVPPFPFAFYFGTRDDRKNRNKREVYMIRAMFEELNSYRLLELIWDFNKRMDFVLHDHSRIVVAAVEDMLQYIHTDGPCKRLRMDRIIFLYAGRLLERDAMLMFAGLDRQRLSRMIVAGDRTGEMPRPRSSTTSLFEKLCRLGVRYERPAMPKTLNATLDERFGLADFAPALVPLDKLLDGDGAAGATERNPGFALRAQFIDVKGRERVTAHPGEVQNLEEAEWVVALFHYMLALGYPPKEIVILTPYQAQKLLIIDVLHSRARATNPPLPFPRAILSFEEHVGETVSFVLMSLVRTSTLQDDLMGDPRRSIFAASAARKGLYVVGNAKVFRNHLIFGQLIRAAPDGKLRLRFDNFFKRAPADPRGRAPSNSITNLDEASVPAAKRQKMVVADGKVEDPADVKAPAAAEDFVVDGLGHLGSLVALMLWNRPHSLFMPSPKLLPPPPPPATKPKVA